MRRWRRHGSILNGFSCDLDEGKLDCRQLVRLWGEAGVVVLLGVKVVLFSLFNFMRSNI